VVHRGEAATLSEGRLRLPFPARWIASQSRHDEPHRGVGCFLPASWKWQSSWVRINAGWYNHRFAKQQYLMPNAQVIDSRLRGNDEALLSKVYIMYVIPL
jgi:hypothetical protein